MSLLPSLERAIDAIFLKITSGKFILTIISGLVFAYLSCTSRLDPKDALMIISIIITFYFSKTTPPTPPTPPKIP